MGFWSIPFTGDQKLYVSVAREMLEQNSWLKPYLWGESYYNKPPFLYWTLLTSWKVFGLNLWATYLPSLIALVMSSYFLGEIAFLLRERRWFLNTGLWFAVSFGAITYTYAAQMEIWTVLFYAASWWAGLKFLDGEHGKRNLNLLYLAFFVAGLSALVKSPLYSGFWVLGFFLYLFIAGEWELFIEKHLYLALGVGVVCGLSWYVYILAVDSSRFYDQYVLQETFGKSGGNSSTLVGFWSGLITLSLPTLLFSFPAIRTLWRERRTDRVGKVVLAWISFPALFFSIFPYRVHSYLILIVPMIALTTDWGLFRLAKTSIAKKSLRFAASTVAIACLALAAVLMRSQVSNPWITLLWFLSALSMLAFGFTNRIRGVILSLLLIAGLIHASAVQIGEKDMNDLREWLKTQPQSTEFFMIDYDKNVWHEATLLELAIDHRVLRVHSPEAVTQNLDARKTLLCSADDFEKLNLGSSTKTTIWKRLKTKAQLPLKAMFTSSESIYRDFLIVEAISSLKTQKP